MSGFFNAPRGNRGGAGAGPKTESVVFLVDKIVAGKQANWETDHFEGRLFYPSLGVAAEYNEGDPITKIKVFQSKPSDKSTGSGYARPSIYDKQFKPAIGEKMQPGALVLMESATYDQARGGFVGDWMKVMSAAAFDPNTQFPSRNWIMVRPEYKNEDGSLSQKSTILDTEYSKAFKGVEQFKAIALGMLQQAVESPSLPGVPAVVVRAVDPDSKQSMTAEIALGFDRDKMVRLSPKETVDAFIARETAKAQDPDQSIAEGSWISAMTPDSPFFFEVVPASTINTGKQSMPYMQLEAKKKGVAEDYCDSIGLCTYGVEGTDRAGNKNIYPRTGFVHADILAVRKLGAEVPGWDSDDEYTPWTRTYTRGTGQNREIRGRTEFPSATLPADIEKAFAENGKTNGKAGIDWRRARKQPKPEAVAEDQQAMAPSGP